MHVGPSQLADEMNWILNVHVDIDANMESECLDCDMWTIVWLLLCRQVELLID